MGFDEVETFTVYEDGREVEYEVLFSFESEDYAKSYLVYQEKTDGDEEVQLMVSGFDPESEEMQLNEIVDEDECAMISAVLEAYFSEEEAD